MRVAARLLERLYSNASAGAARPAAQRGVLSAGWVASAARQHHNSAASGSAGAKPLWSAAVRTLHQCTASQYISPAAGSCRAFAHHAQGGRNAVAVQRCLWPAAARAVCTASRAAAARVPGSPWQAVMRATPAQPAGRAWSSASSGNGAVQTRLAMQSAVSRAALPQHSTAASGTAAAVRRAYAAWSDVAPRGWGQHGGFRVMQQRGADVDPMAVVYTLMGLNVAGFVLWNLQPGFMFRNAFLSLRNLKEGRVHVLITSAFSQRDTMHLLGNMLGLYFFGREVGRAFGGRTLLALYLAGGLVGSLAHIAWKWSQIRELPPYLRDAAITRDPGALGASGAVNAVMIVNVLLYPTQTVLLYGIIPMPMALLGALWVYSDISGSIRGMNTGVGHIAHLGGAATGLLFFLGYKRGLIRPRGYW